eukprot:6024226-Pyramimonas_sp.AAC.1
MSNPPPGSARALPAMAWEPGRAPRNKPRPLDPLAHWRRPRRRGRRPHEACDLRTPILDEM